MRARCALAGLVALLIPAAAAHAADCPKGASCHSITVPLDHSGGVPGTLPLAYAHVPATGARTGTIVLLSGGPGQAGIPLTADILRILADLRPGYDFVFPDQRGSGRSGAVNCERESFDPKPCAAKLGARRAFFTTAETASDIEDLRVALGVDRLTLLGLSYGTMVAQEYARRHPEHTAALVLDSTPAPGGLDVLDRTTLQALPRVLREVCTADCLRTVGDPMKALERAVTRLRRGPVTGPLVRQNGTAGTWEVTEAWLLMRLKDSDFQDVLREELPAAISSLAAGDAAPLIHAADYWILGSDATTEVNWARHVATYCAEARMPWSPDSPVAGRAALIAGLGPSAFAPFSVAAGMDISLGRYCQDWPPTAPPAPAVAAEPDVPVLVLSSRHDLRTPVEGAQLVVARYPRATLFEIDGIGHSVLRNDRSKCARNAVVSFVTGRATPACTERRPQPFVAAASYQPADLDDVAAVGANGRAGRTLGAVYMTLNRSRRERTAFEAWYGIQEPTHLPGLRHGYLVRAGSAVKFHGVETVRGVRVSGRLSRNDSGTLTVSGPAAAGGTLTFRRGRVTGMLGGRRVSSAY